MNYALNWDHQESNQGLTESLVTNENGMEGDTTLGTRALQAPDTFDDEWRSNRFPENPQKSIFHFDLDCSLTEGSDASHIDYSPFPNSYKTTLW